MQPCQRFIFLLKVLNTIKIILFFLVAYLICVTGEVMNFNFASEYCFMERVR